MKIVDLNVLIYATDTESKHHNSARSWFDTAMASSSTIGLPTAVTVGFVRLATNPRVMLRPLNPNQAIDIVESWISRSSVSVPQPTARHYTVLRELLDATGVGGNLVSDAHLAALAIEHGAELCTYDSDFTRFPGVVSFRP